MELDAGAGAIAGLLLQGQRHSANAEISSLNFAGGSERYTIKFDYNVAFSKNFTFAKDYALRFSARQALFQSLQSSEFSVSLNAYF